MNRNKMTQQELKTYEYSVNNYPGMSIDMADDNKVSGKRVRKATKRMNNNPRNNEIDG